MGPRTPLAPGQFELVSKALADPRRVAVLEAIADEECCACQHLRDQFPVTKATISHHIKELVRAGVVEARREGQYLHCMVRREVLEASIRIKKHEPRSLLLLKSDGYITVV
jgi:ArsR family transcriptional regulator